MDDPRATDAAVSQRMAGSPLKEPERVLRRRCCTPGGDSGERPFRPLGHLG